jgi:hypothetical protein
VTGVAVSAAVALALGLLADVVSGLVRRVAGRTESWWAPVHRVGSDTRLLLTDRDRLTVLEAVGLGAAVAGAAMAGAMAMGATPGTLVSLYLLLLLTAAGGHLAASTPLTRAGEQRAARARAAALAAEPALVLALGAAFGRWHTADLAAIRGANHVLGSGLTVGPTAAAVGLGVAAGALVLAGALRLPPEPGEEAGAHGGVSLAVAGARWAGAGAVALAGAGLLLAEASAGGAAWVLDGQALVVLGAAAAGAVVLGAVAGAVSLLGGRWRMAVGAATVAAALAGAALVLSA